jgi:hypothetical protein
MDKADINKQNNDDVLRAGDIIPPYKGDNPDKVEPPELDIPRFNLAEKIMAEQRKAVAVKRKAPSRDLTGDILALHKSNGGANPTLHKLVEPVLGRVEGHRETESVRHAVMPPTTLLFDQQVITEIVARDISQMRRDFVSC